MDLDDFIVTTFCMIDDTLKELLGSRRLRQRGPTPTLSDSEVLTMEIVGEYLSLDQDKAIFDYFGDTTGTCSLKLETFIAQHSSDRQLTCAL